jgi:acylphosphatase
MCKGYKNVATQRLLIEGRVQRVGYRDWAVRTAHQLGVVGWVRNLGDGRVEILADGDDMALDTFIDRCREGPMMAHVAHIDTMPADVGNVKGFTKRFTA